MMMMVPLIMVKDNSRDRGTDVNHKNLGLTLTHGCKKLSSTKKTRTKANCTGSLLGVDLEWWLLR